jgi:hypothetical protein
MIMVKPDVMARKAVIALERQLGSQILKVPRGAGFDVRVNFNGSEKHIEAKGIERDDTFFAINGLAGVQNLLSDNNYYVYFCDVTNDMILITSRDFIFRNMGWENSEETRRRIKEWIDIAYVIRRTWDITVDGRIRFTLQYPIRKLIQGLHENPTSIDDLLRNTMIALWTRENNEWRKLFP